MKTSVSFLIVSSCKSICMCTCMSLRMYVCNKCYWWPKIEIYCNRCKEEDGVAFFLLVIILFDLRSFWKPSRTNLIYSFFIYYFVVIFSQHPSSIQKKSKTRSSLLSLEPFHSSHKLVLKTKKIQSKIQNKSKQYWWEDVAKISSYFWGHQMERRKANDLFWYKWNNNEKWMVIQWCMVTHQWSLSDQSNEANVGSVCVYVYVLVWNEWN